jgi:hypothetical protein
LHSSQTMSATSRGVLSLAGITSATKDSIVEL